MSPHYSDTDAPPHTLGPGDLVRDLKIRGRHDLGGRVMSALSPRPLITMASPLQSHLQTPSASGSAF
jgi:hypothetical protein